jgi:hypothetical protein
VKQPVIVTKEGVKSDYNSESKSGEDELDHSDAEFLACLHLVVMLLCVMSILI